MTKQDKPAHPGKTAGYGDLKPDSFYGLKPEDVQEVRTSVTPCLFQAVALLIIGALALMATTKPEDAEEMARHEREMRAQARKQIDPAWKAYKKARAPQEGDSCWDKIAMVAIPSIAGAVALVAYFIQA